MELTINGQQETVELFASDRTIRDRFAFDNEGLPEYFLIEGKVVPEGNITVTDVRDILGDVDIKDITTTIDSLALFKIPKQTLLLIWITVNIGSDIENISDVFFSRNLPQQFGKIYSGYIRLEDLVSAFKAYQNYFQQERQKLLERIEEKDFVNENLQDLEEQSSSDFSITETVWQLTVESGSNIINSFNAMNVSTNLPFIATRYGGRDFYKVFETIKPKKDWIISPEEGTMVFFVFDGTYTKGVWNSDNTIHFSSQGQEDSHQNFIDVLTNSLEGLTIQKDETLRVKGQYQVNGISINPYILADLAMNDYLLSYFLFANEPAESVTKKHSFTLFYRPGRDFVKVKSPVITFNFREQSVVLKISKIEDQASIPVVQKVLNKLLTYYVTFEPETMKEYSELKISIAFKPIAEARDTKSGKRLKELKRVRPDLFKGSFSTACQHENKQPYLIPSARVQDYIKFAEKKTGEKGSLFVLNFPPGSDDWYGCLPRNDEHFTRKDNTPYPSITVNTHWDKDENPCYPCCTSKLSNVSRIKRCFGKVEKEVRTVGIGHILAPIKHATPGRFARLPNLIETIAKRTGITEISEGKTRFTPLLRYGVTDSPDSFLRCLVCASRNDYFSFNKELRDEMVKETKANILDYLKNRPYQGLYGKTFAQIKKEINSGYIDPREYVDIMKDYFDVNIILFGVTPNHPTGKILIPKGAVAYIEQKFQYKDTVVVNVFYKSSRITISSPTQSELLVYYDKTFVTKFADSDFIRECKALQTFTNIVTRVY